MESITMYDLIIIGSGPAGYVAAIRAGQTGLKTAIIEKNQIGGMCLNWGCIPSKSLMESVKLYQRITKDASRFGIDGIEKGSVSFNWNKAVKRSDGIVKKLTGGVEFLLKKNAVEIIKGEAKIVSANSVLADNRLIETKNIIIATGSSSPKIKSSVEGLVIEPEMLFKEREVPQNIVVIGKSPVAVELAQLFGMTGRTVTLVSDTDKIMPKADTYVSDFIINKLKKEKIKILFNVKIDSTDGIYKGGVLNLNGEEIPCDMIINASDRKANMIDSDIAIDVADGYISVDEHFETSVKSIYAVGDVNGTSMFAHVGSAQGLNVVNRLGGIVEKLDMQKIPMNMYTVPEAAQIGMTESQVKDLGVEFKISEFSLAANGKAQTEGSAEGFVRILSDIKYGEVLGVQIVAPNATDLINEAAAYMQLESTVYDIARTVHTHPTVSEVFMEAGFEAVDQAIHK
ncbi:MAG: dihydrolipoyl dehydrogenase [Bacteroidetes bacterium GWE2_39_28]|nr:MAG: dihydrolipoyl dehydrogenase [Bacteroidetes bacterium GWE2_39_28]OFY14051.1 MAG: dihydrolipoyl dehydrogenase [Bacteroidetes bacterium GWF2_39_10]HCT93983.1 dihydrolipoyl dehydrogenase [Rikenellaceae bacterium]